MGLCQPNVDTDSSPENVKMLIGLANEMLKQENVESVLFGGKRIGEQSNFEKLDCKLAQKRPHSWTNTYKNQHKEKLMKEKKKKVANDFGQLGDGTEERRKYPKKVKKLESEFMKFVSCEAHCSACIVEPRENDGTISTGRLWIWGQNQIIREVSCGAVHVRPPARRRTSFTLSRKPPSLASSFVSRCQCCPAFAYSNLLIIFFGLGDKVIGGLLDVNISIGPKQELQDAAKNVRLRQSFFPMVAAVPTPN
ncbi:hypothetical protein HN873_023850 [Arachis hypogaea]